ncbi:MAG: hypothetical protein KZY57_09880 [Paeniclostridium sp.]|nr:hypothetical protein [Paeniclostridium sp.]MBW4863122.1 hypothetical protein [Paeniclostridium sp.]
MKSKQILFNDVATILTGDNSNLNTKSVLNDLLILGVATIALGTSMISSKIITKHKSYFPDLEK